MESDELRALWEEFHQAVNMSSEELREWLLTEASGETAFPAEPGLDVPALGRRVARILRKRRVDVTADDITVMWRVVNIVRERLEERPDGAEQRDNWRRSLMSVGHDPLKPT